MEREEDPFEMRYYSSGEKGMMRRDEDTVEEGNVLLVFCMLILTFVSFLCRSCHRISIVLVAIISPVNQQNGIRLC